MKASRILAVDHVELEAPPSLEDDLRWFYGEVAELEEVGVDADDPVGLCFRSERIKLRIRIVATPKIDPVATRVTIAVGDLQVAAERLAERKIACELLTGISFTDRRLQALDPAGNRVELKQVFPAGAW